MSRSSILTAMILVVAAAASPPPATATPPPREGKFCSSPFAVAPDPADCARYFRCLDRKYYAMRCGAGLLFDAERYYCDDAEAVECETSEFESMAAVQDTGCIEDGFSNLATFPRPSHVQYHRFHSLGHVCISIFRS